MKNMKMVFDMKIYSFFSFTFEFIEVGIEILIQMMEHHL